MSSETAAAASRKWGAFPGTACTLRLTQPPEQRGNPRVGVHGVASRESVQHNLPHVFCVSPQHAGETCVRVPTSCHQLCDRQIVPSQRWPEWVPLSSQGDLWFPTYNHQGPL